MTHASRLRAEQMQQKIGNWPSGKVSPPQWLLDRLATEKLTGGFNVRKSNICKVCFEAKSSNGTCQCSE